jgi:hypothetical protein|nr:protein kinase [Kofleriaceae bacterium]
MSSGRTYLAALAHLHALDDPNERRRVARAGLAVLAQIAEREPAPLEGLPADELLLATRVALADGMLADMEWMSAAGAAVALFELAQALPAGPERRELGRRVLTRLRDADRDTFVRLSIALARSSPRLLAAPQVGARDRDAAVRARAEVVLSAPLTAPGAIGELALALLAQPLLADTWVEAPATGALPGRRLAARVLAHGAREAVRRHDGGDRGGVAVLARPGTRAALARLLHDREALVWRFAGIARGLLAHVDSVFADDIDRELGATASSSELRRAAASAAAALERGGAAARWQPILVERAAKEPGVARGVLLGLAGFAFASPGDADDLACALISDATTLPERRGLALDACEALADLRREEAAPLLPRAAALAHAWVRAQLAAEFATDAPPSARPRPVTIRPRSAGVTIRPRSTQSPVDAATAVANPARAPVDAPRPAAGAAVGATRPAVDDNRWAVLHALEAELGDGGGVDAGIAEPLARARAALDAGDVTAALRAGREAVDEIAAAADWLERATDDDPIDRRHSIRLLRELDRELLGDNALTAALALAPDTDPAREQLARAIGTIEAALLAREATAETGAVAHGGLRLARLRALVRLLDGVRASADSDLGPRLAAVRQLMARAQQDHSTLRRAVWAAMTRAGDALLRDGHAEITDLLLAFATAFPDDDFNVVREASMVPDVEASFAAYVRLHQATWRAADPDDVDAVRTVVERVGELADALPPEQSPRVESVRLAIARLGNHLERVVGVASLAALPGDAFDAIATELGALARRTYGARARLGLAGDDLASELEIAARAIGSAVATVTATASVAPETTSRVELDTAVATAIDAARACLPAAIAAAIERVLVWLARRPHAEVDRTATAPLDPILPGWVPLSRLLGGYYVVRPIGRGAGGSVMLGVRADERRRADRQLVALKVPDYTGAAARNLSEQEFEALFREEAGALLVLPAHPNIARFVTFDASARPKPLLAMEFVRGVNLERTLESESLDMPTALTIVDGVLAGVEAMHRVHIAHLDVKPANVVLRESTGEAVLVDFGLAGRRLRTGCGSLHYGAAEVWTDKTADLEPFPADVYATACVAYEVLTGHVLVGGDSMNAVLTSHFSANPGGEALAKLERAGGRLLPLAQLLRAAISRDPRRRPSASRLRAGFAAIAPELATLRWPISS